MEAQQILKCGHASGLTNLTIEYDVSVMQSVEFSLGPLLIEIERPMNEKLGIILSNYSNLQASTMDTKNDICPAGIFIASILPASIADRLVKLYSMTTIRLIFNKKYVFFSDAVHFQLATKYSRSMRQLLKTPLILPKRLCHF